MSMKLMWSMWMCLIFVLPTSAQEQKNDRKQRIEAVKIAFITDKLDLSTNEAERFWPVYNNYQQELETLLKQKRQSRLDKKNNPEQALDDDLKYENRLLELKKKYRREFSKILSPEKVLKLYQAEREFREQLIKQLRERKIK